MTLLDDLLHDLAQEGDRLRAVVADLPEPAWRTPTPAQGWDIATQIAHLSSTDEALVHAAAASHGDTAGWDEQVLRAMADPAGFVDAQARAGATEPPARILARWDAARAAVPVALRGAEGKLPWFGPPMSPASMATARIMETWAHGLDVHDALGVEPAITDTIRHVCHLGIRTRAFAFSTHDLAPPTEEFRVELTAPSGTTWEWGPADAAQRVTGPAEDFARLVTQRVHRDDTALIAVGADAQRWLSIAQAFAGPPGAGRGSTS